MYQMLKDDDKSMVSVFDLFLEIMLVLQKERNADLLFIDIRHECLYNKPSLSLSCAMSWLTY